MMDPLVLTVGALSFGLHFLGKWGETTEPFPAWFLTKQSLIYWVTSLILCILSLIWQPELAPVLGMQPITYAIVSCYGGGHLVSRLINLRQASVERKAAKE